VTEGIFDDGLEARIFEVEYALGIRNTDNAVRFNQRVLAEAKHATQK